MDSASSTSGNSRVVCRNCGRVTERASIRCTRCGNLLRRSIGRRVSRWVLGSNPQQRIIQIIIALIFAAVAYFAITRGARVTYDPQSGG